MEGKNKKNRPVSWFWRWFLNNQVVTALLVVLLILLIVFLFTKVSYLFAPIWQFLAIVGLPIILAGILYYLMNPVVDYFEKRKVPRLYSIIGLFVLVVALIVWGSVVIIPKIQEQTVSFISNFPQYVDTIDNKLTEILRDPLFNQFREQLETAGDKFMNSAGDMIQDISKSTVQSLGSFVGAVATILVALLTMPFILFYLLKDGKRLAPYFVKFLPTRMQKPTLNVLSEMNSQVSSYKRAINCGFCCGNHVYDWFCNHWFRICCHVGNHCRVLESDPILRLIFSNDSSHLLAIVAGPFMIIKVLIVFAVEQTIEGRLISPLVLGNQLAIHPVTILLVLLTSGKLFGIVGVILGFLFMQQLK